MPRGWEGNRRSGVTLAMRHGLKWFIHLRAQRPRVGDEHPAYAPAGAWLPLPLPLICPLDYVPIVSKYVSFHDVNYSPFNNVCNIAALDGTNQ